MLECRFNPCFNGSCFSTTIPDSVYPPAMIVSILVLMDLAFQLCVLCVYKFYYAVSILVLMDLAFQLGIRCRITDFILLFQSLF